jgi:DNA-binding transcriptional ArsR family regulator
MNPGNRRIGTERESSLHRSLKLRYAGGEDRTETSLGGYVCDGISETGEVIEIQTGSFGPLKAKARDLSAQRAVRIIHPIVLVKHIELYDPRGELLYRRKSPRKGSPWDLFKALLYAPELAALPGLTIELALVDVLERRVRDGQGSWRRRGDRIADKSLAAYHGSIFLADLRDYRRFAPFPEGEEFTVRSLGERAGISPAAAQKTLYVLTKLGVVLRVRRRGNAWVYTRREGEAEEKKTRGKPRE